MSTTDRHVTVLDMSRGSGKLRRVDPAKPILTAFDYAATRGDGAFEAMHIVDGLINKPERHLERMARSLQHLGIIGPTPAQWTELINDLAAQWPADAEGVIKLVISRGQEGGPTAQPPTVYGTITPLDPDLKKQRRKGIDVISLTFGYPAAVREQSPWLLGGTKYLSYAVNMAAKRQASSQGADDVIFVSHEGNVLEGPNATVLWLTGSTLHTTPADTGILRGTTQEKIFDEAESVGLQTAITTATIGDLLEADAVWMSSSTRGIAAVKSIDGKTLDQSEGRTADLQRLSGLPEPKSKKDKKDKNKKR